MRFFCVLRCVLHNFPIAHSNGNVMSFLCVFFCHLCIQSSSILPGYTSGPFSAFAAYEAQFCDSLIWVKQISSRIDIQIGRIQTPASLFHSVNCRFTTWILFCRNIFIWISGPKCSDFFFLILDGLNLDVLYLRWLENSLDGSKIALPRLEKRHYFHRYSTI